MANEPNPKRRLALGPIRQQRIGTAASIPLLLLVMLGVEMRPAVRVAIAALGLVATFRAWRMGIEMEDKKLIVRNFATTEKVDLSEIRSAQFRKARGVIYRLVLDQKSGGTIFANGVSATGRAFRDLGTDETRQEKRASERLARLLDGTDVPYIPTSAE